MFKSFENLVSEYIKYLKEIRPNGSYKLGGWSLGGNIAYEMARQLKEKDDVIEVLYLMDSYFLKKNNYLKCFDKVDPLKYEENKIFIQEQIKDDEQYQSLFSQYKNVLSEDMVMELAYRSLLLADLVNVHEFKEYDGKTFLFKAMIKDDDKMKMISENKMEYCNGLDDKVSDLKVIEINSRHLGYGSIKSK
jgi:thioesterase domain-containing protein